MNPNRIKDKITSRLQPKKLGELLVHSRLITHEQLLLALEAQKHSGEKLGTVLIRQRSVSALQLYRQLMLQYALRASAFVLASFMLTAMPSSGGQSHSALPESFSLATALHSENGFRYPALFGTQEIRSHDITAFTKWTSAMERYDEQLRTVNATSPRIRMWKHMIGEYQGRTAQEQLKAVNDFINLFRYIEDHDNYGISDYWATPIEFLSRGGDCEDFAIAKYASLRALGFAEEQMRIAIVNDKVKGIAHAVLVVYAEGNSYVLDNQEQQLRQASAAADRYEPVFSINSTHWWKHKA